MKRSASLVLRTGAVVLTALTCTVGSGASTHAQGPPFPTQVFTVRNFTPFPMILASYSTGNPYPEWVKPAGAGAQVPPAGTMEVGLRPREVADTVIKANFDNIVDGKQRPLGQVEFKLEGSNQKYQQLGHRYLACWPSADVACDPRGWSDVDVTRVTLLRRD